MDGIAKPGRRSGPGQLDAAAPERRIVAAACRVIARKGVEATRVADIAREAGTSTGTVHYYFETKEDVLVAALRWANERPYGPLEDLLESAADAKERLAALLDAAVPYPGERQEDFVLWVETSIAASRLRPRLGRESESVGRRWRSYFVDVIGEGVRSGTFHPVASVDEVAERLLALADGLAFKAAIGQPWMPAKRVRELLGRFAAEQLDVASGDFRSRERVPTRAGARA